MSGQATVTSAGRTWRLGPGIIHLSPPGTTNYWTWDPASTSREGHVEFTMNARPDWPRHRTFPPENLVTTLLQHIVCLSLERTPGWETSRDQAMRYAVRAYVSGAAAVDPYSSVPLPEPVERAVGYVQRLWDLPPLVSPRLPELATAAGVTKGHLCQLFERHFGVGPVTAFRILRIQRAAIALPESNLSLSAIAQLSGFANEFHFSRTFRDIVGVTPSAYRIGAGTRLELPPGLARLAGRVWRDREA